MGALRMDTYVYSPTPYIWSRLYLNFELSEEVWELEDTSVTINQFL